MYAHVNRSHVLYTRTHVEDPAVHVKVRWIAETPK